MRRSVLGLDRVIVVLFGLIMLAFGIAIAAWYKGGLRRLFPQFPKKISTDKAGDPADTNWWP